MATRTISLLPAIFQTDANKKFLNATLDQLVTDPKFKKLNGFVGRTTTLAYKSTDPYVVETTANAQRYQLEPSLFVNDPTNPITANYVDLLSAISFYGGNIDNHDRLFQNEQYSYGGLFDYDKFVNYNQYYWLPNGPDSVLVTGSSVSTAASLDVTRNETNKTYIFSGFDVGNPTIVLERGSTYTFNVDQAGYQFYVQAQPGVDGVYSWQPNMSSREVYGVTNNGAETGTVTFDVPAADAQDWILEMVEYSTVTYATTYTYRDLANKTLDYVLNTLHGLDGDSDINNKTVIFTDYSVPDSEWTADDSSTTIDPSQRYWIFQIQVDYSYTDPIVKLSPASSIPEGEKVRILGGVDYGYREFYRPTGQEILELVPIATARFDTLYYQDAEDAEIYGIFKLIDTTHQITTNVDTDIIGKANYTSLNDVVFTNGLKVTFDYTVEPTSYVGNEYYVEGVGDSIKLILVTDLTNPEAYIKGLIQPWDSVPWGSTPWDPTTGGPTELDYITINRGSQDKNSWTRSNRWFHYDVILATSEYNGTVFSLDQTDRANRPIIEFNSDLQLFNYGSQFAGAIDLIDFTTTDAFSYVEGSTMYVADGVDLDVGIKIIFAADTDSDVRNKIYSVNVENPNADGSTFLRNLTLIEEGTIAEGESIVIQQGTEGTGKTYYLSNGNWVEAQAKTQINQEPYFAVYDPNEISLADVSTYANSSFAGTKIFSYKHATTGTVDTNLGFALSYKNFVSLGDIIFNDNFNSDTFTYDSSGTTTTAEVSIGSLRKNNGSSHSKVSSYVKTHGPSKQYQILNFTMTADNINSEFNVYSAGVSDSYLKNFLVYVNNQILNNSDWTTYSKNNSIYLQIPSLVVDDKVLVYVYETSPIDTSAYYQVPSNLENNADNQIADSYTLGQLRNHIIKVYQLNKLTSGIMPGDCNLRDLPLIKDSGGTILQHSGSMIPVMLFMCHPQLNFIEATQYASREYAKFKNKILDTATKLDSNNVTDIPGFLDDILAEINAVKTDSFPWYYSDMIPYGSDRVETDQEININDDNQRVYNLNTYFDITTVNRRAVLVYLNGVQLIYGADYEFTSSKLGVELLDSLDLNINDTLRIVEYSTTNGCWIPETPTKLGMYPKFLPEIYIDNTFVTPISVLRGHDGSVTPTFGDFRDDVLLEFEKRIYNNIKVTLDNHKISLYDVKPGAFRNTNYTLDEYNQVLGRFFSSWVGLNKLDLTDDSNYLSNNSLTWNYEKLTDKIFGEPLQGSWQAIFQYFYDTVRPHTHPWEMLGFSIKPDWWDGRYGTAPFTSGNLVLWEDLRDGVIYDGDRAGTDSRFARPNLLDIIPVDEYGNLKDPTAVFVKQFDSRKTNYPYEVGQIGPVEAAWYRTSDFAFAVQMAMALMKPAEYFGTFVDNHNYVYNTVLNEFSFAGEKRRIAIEDYHVNGEVIDGENYSYASYTNYIADRLQSMGIDPVAKLKSIYAVTDIQLSYSMGGFADLDQLTILAEQASPTSTTSSIVMPDENLHLILKKSVPLEKVTYSAVIVEKNGSGFTISGYDTNNAYFTIIPSIQNSNKTTINVLGLTVPVYGNYQDTTMSVPYGTTYNTKEEVVDFLISYERYLVAQGISFDEVDPDLGTNRNFKLSAKEFLTWVQQGWNADTVVVLNPLASQLTITTTMSVVDEVNGMNAGSTRVLNTNFVYLRNNQFNVVRIGNEFTIKALDTDLALVDMTLIRYDHALVLDNATVFNDVIYEPATGNRQQRIKIVGYKTLDYDGSLSAPGFYYNSPNVDLWEPGTDYRKGSIVSFKSQLYIAIADAPGVDSFAYENWSLLNNTTVKTGLLPSFSNLVGDIEKYYDFNNVTFSQDILDYSVGLIGYRTRQYFTDIGLDDVTQKKFFQGYIKEKGSAAALNALLGATFDNFSTEVDVYENWAFRVGSYGATDITQYIEVSLPEDTFSSNPSFGQFDVDNITVASGRTYFTPSGTTGTEEILHLPKFYSANLFISTSDYVNYNTSIRSAGYFYLEDVDGTIFDINNPNYADKQTFIGNIGSGFKLWIARKPNNDWDMLRADQIVGEVTQINNALDNQIEIVFSKAHGLVAGDYFVLKNFSDVFDNIYRVVDTHSVYSVIVSFTDVDLSGFSTVGGSGILYKFSSTRFKTISDWANYTPVEGYRTGDLVAIDNWGPNYIDWATFQKSDLYTLNDRISDHTFTANEDFGSSVSFIDDGQIMLAGVSQYNTGKVLVYKNLSDDPSLLADPSSGTDYYPWDETETVTATNLAGFGDQITSAEIGWFAVSATESDSNTGYIFIYNRTNDIADGSTVTYDLVQAFTAGVDDGSSLPIGGTKFGYSTSMSYDGRWLYVGAPDDPNGGVVYAYAKETSTINSTGTLTGNGGTNYTPTGIDLTTVDPYQLLVTDTTAKTYILNKDYQISGTDINFYATVANGLVVTIQAQTEYFTLVDKIPSSLDISSIDVVPGDNFGFSVDATTEGAQIVIGSPFNSDAGTTAGKTSIYDRSIHSLVADGTSLVYTVPRAATTNGRRTTVDGVEASVTYVVTAADPANGDPGSTQVTFATAPTAGSIISVETNHFQEITAIVPVNPDINENFGWTAKICSASCVVYVGAPGLNAESELDFRIGVVYRYTNTGRLYGIVNGSKQNPSVHPGHSIRLNNFDIVFTGSTLTDVVNDINNANLPGGITATDNNGYIQITADILLSADKLKVLPGWGTALADLGIDVFDYTQTIDNPVPDSSSQFGKTITIHPAANKIYIGSDSGTGVEFTTFDSATTTFDENSIKFIDEVIQSGSVAVYERIAARVDSIDEPAFFIFSEFLEPGSFQYEDKFGTSIAASGNYVVVGSPGSDYFGTDYGSLFAFKASQNLSWNVRNQAVARVDLTALNKIYIYDIATREKLVDLDYIDPIRGKVSGLALEDIDFIAENDPANYGNNYTTKNEVWGKDQIGKVWWNTNNVRYLDYEQGTFEKRSANWGKQFPGSSISIYEWTSSPVLPSAYIDAGYDGVPAYDDSQVVTETTTDIVTDLETNTYYFWVENKTSVPVDVKNRRLTISAIADLIDDPKGQGVSYAVVTSPNTFGVYNVESYLTNSDATLHIDYDIRKNSRVIHSEYDLVQEGNADSLPSSKILNKMKDSLAGLDSYGNVVPDPTLGENLKYGIDIRPRQTIFRNQTTAVQKAITFLNDVFANINLLETIGLDIFDINDPVPSLASGLWDISAADLVERDYIDTTLYDIGTKILIMQDSNYSNQWSIYELQSDQSWLFIQKQTYSLAPYLTYINYVASDFDATVLPTYILNAKSDLQKYTFADGDVVKVINDGSGRAVTYLYTLDSGVLTSTVVAHEQATVEFSSDLYADVSSVTLELRGLFDAVFDTILVDDLAIYANELVFVLVREVLHEQKSVDWLFKTSFIDIFHNYRQLEQNTVYIKENTTFLQDYIDETKPYHTKVREYKFNYTGLDPWSGDVTDFDLPAYYDASLDGFRVPDETHSGDDTILSTRPEYAMWYQNQRFGVESVIIENGGIGYTVAPTLVFGGGINGNNATATALISGGIITAVTVLTPGEYSTTPTITLVDNGSVTTPAVLYAQLGNDHLRTMTVTMKFDRFTYDTQVKTWTANTDYNRGDYVVYNKTLYFVEPADNSSLVITTGSTFDTANFIEIFDQGLDKRNTPAEWAPATDYVLGNYIAHHSKLYRATASFTSGNYFDDTYLTQERALPEITTYWAPNTDYTADEYILYKNKTYIVLTAFTSNDYFDPINLMDVTGIAIGDFGSANDRITAYYNPDSGQPGYGLDNVQTGLSYGGEIVTGEHWPVNDGSTVAAYQNDTNLYSYFTDTDLGTRPEDIITSGDGFVSTYSSYAPEEMIPGRTFDCLNLKVFTSPYADTSEYGLLGAGIQNQLVYYTGDGTTTTFSYKVAGALNDVVTVISRTNGRLRRGVDYTLDFANYNVVFNTAPALNELIYVLTQNDGGNYLLYDKTYTGNGSTTQYTIPTVYTTVEDFMIFINGDRQFEGTDYSVADVNGLYMVQFNTAPANGDWIHAFVFRQPDVAREIHTYSYVLPTPASPLDPVDRTVNLDRTMGIKGPWHAQMMAFENNTRLRPPNNEYYIADASTISYQIPVSADIDGTSVPDGDIEVYVNGVLQILDIDYTTSTYDPSTIRYITFIAGREPPIGAEVVVSDLTNAEFQIVDSSTIHISDALSVNAGDTIDVTTYSNHDAARIQTKVYSGLDQTTVSNALTYDNVPLDSGSFDGTNVAIVAVAKFPLLNVHSNVNYTFVYKNGSLQFPTLDYTLTDGGTAILFNSSVVVQDTDIIVITEFTENIQTGMLGFRIFRNLLEQTNYYRISFKDSAYLVTDLQQTDTTIYFDNTSRLPAPNPATNTPGFVFMNGERIGYYEKDDTTNTVTRLFRATGGTGAPDVHLAGSIATSGGNDQLVPIVYDSDLVLPWKPAEAIEPADYFTFEGTIYQIDPDYTSLVSLDDTFNISDWNAHTTYNAGDFVVYNTIVYLVSPADGSSLTITTGATFDTINLLDSHIIVRAQFRDEVWYDVLSTSMDSSLLLDGVGLQKSTTTQAEFLKQRASFIPL